MKIEETSFTNANATRLVEQGCAALRAGETTFDLSAVKEVDSATVATLLAWRRTAQELGVTLRLTGVPKSVCSLATLYGVDGLLGTPHQKSVVDHDPHGATHRVAQASAGTASDAATPADPAPGPG